MKHCVAGENRRKHDDVGEQEEPEAKADNDPLVSGATGAMAGHGIGMVAPETMLIVDRMQTGRRCNDGAHAALVNVGRICSRVCRRVRSSLATVAAGITNSSSRRHARAISVAKAPISPAMTSHQMCQMRAKPVIEAKNA